MTQHNDDSPEEGVGDESPDAGGEDDNPRRQIPTEELIESIRRAAAALGRPPTAREFGDGSEYGHQTAINRFGSWNEALEAAGVAGVEGEAELMQLYLEHDP